MKKQKRQVLNEILSILYLLAKRGFVITVKKYAYNHCVLMYKRMFVINF